MKLFKYLLPLILFPHFVFAQALPIRNDSDAVLRDLESNLNVGRNFSVDSSGRIKIGAIVPGTGATNLGKPEDAAHVSGDTGVFALGVNNRNFAAFNSTNGDYTPIMTGDKGVVGTQLMYDSSLGGGSSPIVLEDDAFANLSAVTMMGAVNNRNQSAFNSTQGDVTPIGTDDNGTVAANITYSGQFAGIFSPVRREDQSFVDGEAVVIAGGQALSAIAQSVGASGDVAPPAMDLGNRLITTSAPAGETGSSCSTEVTNTTSTVIVTNLASNRFYVTGITCSNNSAVPSRLTFQDGSGGTAKAVGGVAALATNGGWYQAVFTTPLRLSVNTGLFFAPTTTATATICCATGYYSTI